MFKRDRPNEFDAVLGNQGIAVQGSMILGGVAGIKQRLNSHSLQVKLAALEDAVNHGMAGLQVLLEYLNDRDLQVQDRVYELLESRSEPFVIEHLAKNGIRRYTRHKNRFDLFERLGKTGTAANVDIMMESLECDPSSSPHKLIDYTLLHNSLNLAFVLLQHQ
jgi:ARM-like repeat domain, GUN4-N terminal